MSLHREYDRLRIEKRAFTLVELLSAISVMLVLMVFAVPAITGLARSRNLNYASTVISGCLEHARVTAVAQKTYVWVGFASAPKDGSERLAIAVFGSNDGTQNRTPANLRLLKPISVLDQVIAVTGLDQFGGRPDAGVNDLPLTDVNIVSWPNPVVQTSDFACVLAFAPDGSVKANNQLRRLTEFGIAQATDAARANAVAFQIEGLTGRSNVYRR